MPAANPVTLPLSSYTAKHVRLEVAGDHGLAVLFG